MKTLTPSVAPTVQRFPAMDAVRGTGAFVVLILHNFSYKNWFPNAPLTVDMFFVMSGFLIAYAYEPKLTLGMPASKFISARFLRLYPTAMLGALFGIILAIGHGILDNWKDYSFVQFITSSLASLLLVPYFGVGINDEIFSFNPPLWSMFFEIFVSIAFALSWGKLTNTILVTILMVTLAITVQLDPFQGNARATFFGGFPRVISGFVAGVLISRAWCSGKLPAFNISAPVIVAMIVAIICIPIRLTGIYLLFGILSVWFLIVISIGTQKSLLDGFYSFLASISYPIYVLHWPVLYLSSFIGKKLGFIASNQVFSLGVSLILTTALSYFTIQFFDKPSKILMKSGIDKASIFIGTWFSNKPISQGMPKEPGL